MKQSKQTYCDLYLDKLLSTPATTKPECVYKHNAHSGLFSKSLLCSLKEKSDDIKLSAAKTACDIEKRLAK